VIILFIEFNQISLNFILLHSHISSTEHHTHTHTHTPQTQFCGKTPGWLYWRDLIVVVVRITIINRLITRRRRRPLRSRRDRRVEGDAMKGWGGLWGGRAEEEEEEGEEEEEEEKTGSWAAGCRCRGDRCPAAVAAAPDPLTDTERRAIIITIQPLLHRRLYGYYNILLQRPTTILDVKYI